MPDNRSFIPSLSIFKHQGYRHYWFGRQLVAAARQMVSAIIVLHVYDLARQTRSVEESAFLAGMVGLAQFLPVLMLSLIGGQAADRFDRKMILIISNILRLGLLAALFFASAAPTATALIAIFILSALMGGINAFTPAASNSLYPQLVPRAELPLAIAWNSLGYQGAAILGPAIGGFLYIGGPQTVYAAACFIIVIAIIIFYSAQTPKHRPVESVHSLTMIIEGLRYVRDNKIVLGAISLDLIVVFFGGATALLPFFARDVLHVGPEGFGYLRAAPAVGAILVGIWLAARPLTARVGPWMLIAVGIFGFAMLGFALSKVFWLSLLFLAISGGADIISVFVRQSLIQLATPDAMRGRVSSVSFIFISASNELGEFESGVAARFLGPIGAVILGAGVAVVTAASWTKLFPALSKANRFEDAIVDEAQSKPVP